MDLEGFEPSPATMARCYAAITPQAHEFELTSVVTTLRPLARIYSGSVSFWNSTRGARPGATLKSAKEAFNAPTTQARTDSTLFPQATVVHPSQLYSWFGTKLLELCATGRISWTMARRWAKSCKCNILRTCL